MNNYRSIKRKKCSSLYVDPVHLSQAIKHSISVQIFFLSVTTQYIQSKCIAYRYSLHGKTLQLHCHFFAMQQLILWFYCYRVYWSIQELCFYWLPNLSVNQYRYWCSRIILHNCVLQRFIIQDDTSRLENYHVPQEWIQKILVGRGGEILNEGEC